MILRMHEIFDHFCFYNAWLFVGVLSALFKSHPWHEKIPSFEAFYERYKDDAMIKIYVRISTLTVVWILLLSIAMMLAF